MMPKILEMPEMLEKLENLEYLEGGVTTYDDD